jgi:hypothetical protein
MHLFIDRRLFFERNNAGLKKLSSFVWTDKWLICLPKCHVYFKVGTQLWTVFLIFHISIRIKCNRISEGLYSVRAMRKHRISISMYCLEK